MTRDHNESGNADAGNDRTVIACLASGPHPGGRRRSGPQHTSPASCRACFGWRLPPPVGFASCYAAGRRGRLAPPASDPPPSASLPLGGSGGGIRAAVLPWLLASHRPNNFGGVRASRANDAFPAAERACFTFGGVVAPSGIVAGPAADPPEEQKTKEKRPIPNNGLIFFAIK